jgi:23S rRNA pseudouridine1911/1915/1917 synthase
VSEGLHFDVAEAEAGQRLDTVLAKLADVSRAQIQRWIEAGRVTVNGLPCRASLRVAADDEIEAMPPEVIEARVEPEQIPIRVVHEDADLIVVDKAAGMVVHPAPGHPSGTLVNALLHHCADLAGVGGVLRPGIVHRLDRGTSGILVVAKNDAAHQALAEQFQSHQIERVYQALVRGQPGAESGAIDRPVGRHPRDRKRMSVRSTSGRAARSRWRVLARFPASRVSWLEVRPETGRTHQIRVHLASAGLPIVGDPLYGRGQRGHRALGLSRPALHAATLGFTHPGSGENVRFEAPLPEDLAELLCLLEEREHRGAGR